MHLRKYVHECIKLIKCLYNFGINFITHVRVNMYEVQCIIHGILVTCYLILCNSIII